MVETDPFGGRQGGQLDTVIQSKADSIFSADLAAGSVACLLLLLVGHCARRESNRELNFCGVCLGRTAAG